MGTRERSSREDESRHLVYLRRGSGWRIFGDEETPHRGRHQVIVFSTTEEERERAKAEKSQEVLSCWDEGLDGVAPAAPNMTNPRHDRPSWGNANSPNYGMSKAPKSWRTDGEPMFED